MIKCEITARNFEFDDKVRSYAENKLGALEKYLPRQAREATTCNIVLEDDPNGREDNRFVCEMVLAVPGDTLVSREGTVNIYAAIDIVEAKLKVQIARYKEKHALEPRRARMLSRLTGRQSEAEEGQREDEVAAP